jgi:hypothetical protein
MDFQKQLEEIRKIREAKYLSSVSNEKKEKPVYNYDEKKDFINWIKKCTGSNIIKERMDNNEKQDYKNKISKISTDDLDYFTDSDFNLNFMMDLFKFNSNQDVLQKAYGKYLSPPHIMMIKELLSKSKLSEEFLLKLILDYTEVNKNYIGLIVSTCILETKYTSTIDYIMNLFYSDPKITVSYEQIRLICSKTNITPEKLKFLILRCSNISAYSKCSKTCVEKPNKDLIKGLIRETESKFKCKIDIDLYS